MCVVTNFLTEEVPVKQKPYRSSPAKLKAMKELIDEMLDAGVIEPSSFAWTSPVDLILKKTGGLCSRPCPLVLKMQLLR